MNFFFKWYSFFHPVPGWKKRYYRLPGNGIEPNPLLSIAMVVQTDVKRGWCRTTQVGPENQHE